MTINKAFHLSFFKMMQDHILRYSVKYFFAISALIFLHLTQIQIPNLILNLDDQIKQNHIGFLILEFILVALGVIVFRTISRWYFFYPARIQQRDLRDELLLALSKSNPKNWVQNSTGKLYQLLVTDLEQIRAFVGFALLQMTNLIIALLVMVPAMKSISTDLLWSLLPLGVTFVLFTSSLILTTKLTEKGRSEHDILQQMLVEFYDAKKTLNTFCKEKSATIEFSNQSAKELKYFYLANIIRSFTRPLLLLGGALSTIYAAYIVYKFNYPMNYLLAYGAFIFLLYEPLGYLSWIGIIAAETKVSWERLKKLTQEIENQDSTLPIRTAANHLEFNIKSFDKNNNLSINTNKIYLMFGPTAGGKTVLLHELHNQAQQNGLSSILVPQEPYLFNQLLSDNLFLYQPMDPTIRQHAIELLKLFELADLSDNVEDVLTIPVGEKGKKLSGGQVKRVHLVRSLLFNYQIILWDDPFSAVDVLTEKRVLQYLVDHHYFDQKVVIISSHRISTLKYCQCGIYVSRSDLVVKDLNDREFKDMTMSFFQKKIKESNHEELH